MVFFNYTTMQVSAKIVYYGPGLCGKTTNLLHIHKKTAPVSRGEMVSLETETDRTLFFDLLPLEVGTLGGMRVRLQLYTVPGQVFYNATRKLVLRGVDGIVFVADSQEAAQDANIESLRSLEENLADMSLSLDQIPVVFQYNKRDLRNILGVSDMNRTLNLKGRTHFEAAALHGVGVFETLKSISRLSLAEIRKKMASPEGEKHPATPLRSKVETTPIAIRAVPLPPPSPETPLEFAEQGQDATALKPVKTRDAFDIQRELEALRGSVAPRRPSPPTPPQAIGIDARLNDLLGEGDTRQELRRKAVVEVPAHVLKGASGLKLTLAFDGPNGEEPVGNALDVRLSGNRRLERLVLHVDLELKSK